MDSARMGACPRYQGTHFFRGQAILEEQPSMERRLTPLQSGVVWPCQSGVQKEEEEEAPEKSPDEAGSLSKGKELTHRVQLCLNATFQDTRSRMLHLFWFAFAHKAANTWCHSNSFLSLVQDQYLIMMKVNSHTHSLSLSLSLQHS